ncbi:MAG: VWA domain-containing protein [Cytophagales bacterium]|nr:MAG: VWA domain-containing protein [Cytophagales bacterium]
MILFLLLLNPLLKLLNNYLEKPIIVLAIDNSKSIQNTQNSAYIENIKKELIELSNELKKLPIELKIHSFSDSTQNIDKIQFNHNTSDISQLLKEINSNYSNKNLQGIILASDGIYNQGVNPSYNPSSIPNYTIGLGDIVPKKDILIKSLSFNKISFLGNKFPIIVEIQHFELEGKTVEIKIKQNKKTIDSKRIELKGNKNTQSIEFLIEADKKGYQHYTIEVDYLSQEITKENNIAHAYIEILDNKEKILIVANSPHPDIKAIKSALETKESNEVFVYINGINDLIKTNYDIVIYYQVPSITRTNSLELQQLQKNNLSSIYIIGNQTNLNDFNNLKKAVTIQARVGQIDNVMPSFNEKFDKFKISPEDQSIISEYPPLMIPFGSYQLDQSNNTEVILYQKIGNTISSKPLLIFENKSDTKTGILIGEGIWQWRMTELQETNESKTFDQFICNFIQLTSNKEDRRKFRCTSTQQEYSSLESIFFETEAYNDIYEKIYNNKVDLKLTDENDNTYPYSFINTIQSPKFEVKGLKQGAYKYEATTTISGKQEKYKGEFIVQTTNLEALNTTADHEILKILSQKSNGQFVAENNMKKIIQAINTRKLTNLLYPIEDVKEIIEFYWIFVLIIFLISIEWIIRKYKGSY